jgi:glycerol uptake facilitator-like aquaporin
LSLRRRLVAEALGSLLLATAVIGSGIMATRLAGGNLAIALLANTAATVAALGVLITAFAPISGAHFNPAVTLAMVLNREMVARDAVAYMAVQVAGCCLGATVAHAMFGLPLLQHSGNVRTGPGLWLGEAIATAGLVAVIFRTRERASLPWIVACWIGAAYWFTSSTSFANPAITVARSLTDTFTGIRPSDIPAFVVAQALGAVGGFLACRYLLRESSTFRQ